MKIIRLLAASAAAVTVAAGSAVAADLYTPVPTYTPTPAYVPAPVVQEWTGPYAGVLAGYGWGGFSGTIAAPIGGATAGAFVGFNLQSGNTVYGVEMDGMWSGRSDGAGNGVNWTSSFRGRIGFALDRVMVYGTAGLAVAGVQTSAPSSSIELGWTAGVGVEAAITERLIGRVEYLYSGFGPIGGGTSLSTQEVRAGVGLRF